MLKKKNRKILILAFFVMLTTVLIFSNSLKNSSQSYEDSGFFLALLEPLAERLFGTNPEFLHILVRKGAHFFEFAVLGALTAALLSALHEQYGRRWSGYGWFYLLSIAVIDEFIQCFTGRTSAVEDVVLDFAGAFLGCGAMMLLSAAAERRKMRRQTGGLRKKDQDQII